MAAHSAAAQRAKMPSEVLQALREGSSIPDSRLESLRKFATQLTRNRGWLSERDLEEFFSSGYTEQQALEVILGIAMKTISNYTNHIAHTPVDKPFQSFEWQNPVLAK